MVTMAPRETRDLMVAKDLRARTAMPDTTVAPARTVAPATKESSEEKESTAILDMKESAEEMDLKETKEKKQRKARQALMVLMDLTVSQALMVSHRGPESAVTAARTILGTLLASSAILTIALTATRKKRTRSSSRPIKT